MTGWASTEWRKYIIWCVSELDFRHDLLAMDLLIGEEHGHEIAAYTEEDPNVRYGQVTRCWGGGGLTPGYEEEPRVKGSKRMRSQVVALRNVMRAWPGAAGLLPRWVALEKELSLGNAWALTADHVPGDVDWDALEDEVWACYIQVSWDYRRFHPALPFVRPPLPFEED